MKSNLKVVSLIALIISCSSAFADSTECHESQIAYYKIIEQQHAVLLSGFNKEGEILKEEDSKYLKMKMDITRFAVSNRHNQLRDNLIAQKALMGRSCEK